jgi:NitT/TauT family transport system substrate-binding protein
MRNRILMGTLLALAVCAAPALGMTKEEEDAAWKKEPAYGRVINVGYNGGLCLGTLGIADIKGFYAEEGLKVNVVRMTNDVDAIGTGKVDVVGGHIAKFLVPTINGVRMKFTTGIHTGCKSLYVLNKSDIKTTKDLIGKYVVVPNGIGGSDQNIAMRFFSRDGIDPLKQIKWKVTDAGAGILAMQKGEVSAALLEDQFARRFLDDGTLRVVRSLTFDDDFKNETCCILAINLDFYNENPITAKKITRAHEKASQWILDNIEESVRLLQEHKWVAGDFSLVLSIQKTLNYGISDKATEDTLRVIIRDYQSFGMIDPRLNADDILKKIWDPVMTKE